MKQIPICTSDLHKALKSATNLKNTVLPKNLKFEVYLQVDDDLHKQIEDDAVLAEKIFKGVSKEYKWTVAEMASLAKDIDVAFGKELRKKGWVEAEWQKRAPKTLDEAEARMLTHSQKAIRKWQSVRKDRKKYVVKTATKITIGSLGVATATLGTGLAIAGTVASSGGGIPALVAAIYLNVKAIAALAKQLVRLKKNVDEAEKALQDQLLSLVKSYKDDGPGKVAAKELAKAALEQYFIVSMKSISGAETAISDYKGKLAKVDINTSQMGIKLNKILDDQIKLDKAINDKITKTLASAGYKSKKLPKLIDKSKQLNTATRNLLRDLPNAIARVEDGHSRYNNVYKPAIKGLKAKKPEWVKYGEMSMKLGDLALGAGFTDFGSVESIMLLVDSIGVEFDDVLAEQLM